MKNYKIHKIEEIIGMDLSLLEIRTQLILAYALFLINNCIILRPAETGDTIKRDSIKRKKKILLPL